MVKINLSGDLPTSTNLISLADVKNYLRVTHTADDTLITNLLTAGIEVAQNYTNRKFLQHTYDLTMETWDDVYVSNSQQVSLSDSRYIISGAYTGKDGLQQIVLPYAPLISVASFKYYDSANTDTTWATSNYQVLTFENQKGFIEIKDGITTPTLYDKANAIRIQFNCGYGASTDTDDGGGAVPEAIKTAVLLIIGRMYELREDSVSRLPKASEYILDPYRIKTY